MNRLDILKEHLEHYEFYKENFYDILTVQEKRKCTMMINKLRKHISEINKEV